MGEVRLEEGKPGRGHAEACGASPYFRNCWGGGGGGEGLLKTVHFRAKPWRDLAQLSVSMSLIPDWSRMHLPVPGL